MRHKPQKINVLLALVVLCLGTLTGTVIIVPDAGRMGECAANYVRDAPDFCRYNGHLATSLSSGVGCTQGTFNGGTHPVSSTATLVVMVVENRIKSNNTAGTNHIADARFFADNICSPPPLIFLTRFREVTAVVAGQDLLTDHATLYIPVTGINTFHYTTTNTGGSHVYSGAVLGYYD